MYYLLSKSKSEAAIKTRADVMRNTIRILLVAALFVGIHFGNVRSVSVVFGSDRNPVGNIDTIDVTSANDFFRGYVHTSRPVLIKQPMRNTIPLEKWNDVYLASHHGNSSVNVDTTKYEARGSPSFETSLTDFLSWYTERNVYLITTLPDSLQLEFPLPRCLNCEGFRERFQDFVLWFSSGGSSSTLHYDNVENLYCQIDGTKRWIFVDPQNGSHYIPLDHPEGHYCGVNVSDVDYNKYPTLKKVPFWRAELEAGDCLYVPVNWWHQVNSLKGRNLAVNLWWAPIHSTTQAPFRCDDVTPDDITPDDVNHLSDLTFNPGEWIRYNLIQLAEEHQGKLNYETMRRNVVHEHTGQHLVSRDSFVTLDRNGDRVVDTHELTHADAKSVHKAVNNVPVGAMNTNGIAQVENLDVSEDYVIDDEQLGYGDVEHVEL